MRPIQTRPAYINIDLDFPLAQTLQKILSPGLTDHEVEAVVVCLISHLLIEEKINQVLYNWLNQDAPGSPKNPEKVLKAQTELRKFIVEKLDFAKKYSLIEPFFALHFPQQAKWAGRLTTYATPFFTAALL